MRAFPGPMLIVMLLFIIAHGFFPAFPSEAGALAAWLAGVMVWHRLPPRVRMQVGGMIVIGLVCLGIAGLQGVRIDPMDAAGRSLPILAMLTGVAFLRLAYRAPGATFSPGGHGWGAYLRTMFGLHLFGAIINISALAVFADRLSRTAPLTRRDIRLLGRSFTTVAFYSPFIAGVALALGMIPGVDFPLFAAFGMALAGIGLAVNVLLAWMEEGPLTLARHRGYPMRLQSLWLPAALAAAVMIVHRLWPSLSILLLISLLSPLLVLAALAYQAGISSAARSAAQFTVGELPGMSGELSIFLAAGVLGAGFSALSAAWPEALPALPLNPITGAAMVAILALASMAGVHPLVSVTALVTTLLPSISDPTFLAMVCVVGWGLGSAVGPYSGVSLILAARGDISNWRIPKWNALWCILMVLAAAGVFSIYDALVA
ncbi:MAG: hypothetical protein ISN28_11000 [Ectothiorhodospiraceae bacterium AqS1]|nr:hypothetical protein [Ectothiorhodospiraceae bacterium AqS1]